jgi:hypothetical protein
MRHQHPLGDLMHWATHRIPGVPAHTERPPGHQGRTHHHGHDRRHPHTHHHPHRQGLNHSPARPPRVLAAWQTRIARLFGQDL